MINKLEYYISNDTNPYTNLATERYLLDKVNDNNLILYLWQNKNTVVIGKNQNPWEECRCSLLNEEGGFLARRLSGGGAVFHDLGNVNFTFLYSDKNADITRNLQIIQKACALEGIQTEISGRNDITANGRKFSGNAFYNSKGKCYHHGTLLVCADKEKMARYLTPPKSKLVSKGIKSVRSRVINLSELSPSITCQSIMQNTLRAFNEVCSLSAQIIRDIDTEYIADLAKQYGSWDYLYGSTIDFSLSMENRFDWGNIQLLLKIQDGIIFDTQAYTDSMDSDLSEKLSVALKGCRYEISAVSEAITEHFPSPIKKDIISLFQNQGF